jgi:hypothetical protein
MFNIILNIEFSFREFVCWRRSPSVGEGLRPSLFLRLWSLTPLRAVSHPGEGSETKDEEARWDTFANRQNDHKATGIKNDQFHSRTGRLLFLAES